MYFCHDLSFLTASLSPEPITGIIILNIAGEGAPGSFEDSGLGDFSTPFHWLHREYTSTLPPESPEKALEW